MNWTDAILIVLLAGAMAGAILFLKRKKRSGCCGNCSGCAQCRAACCNLKNDGDKL